MKIMISIIIGLLLGLYTSIKFPQIQHYFSKIIQQEKPAQSEKKTETKQTIEHPAEKFNDADEKALLQTVDQLDNEEFISTDGNEAFLYKVKDMCKIKVAMVGETYYAYRTIYFHHNQLVHMMETEYRTSRSESVWNNTGNEKNALYSTNEFNLKSKLVQDEFKAIISAFKPELIQKC
jgi:hypothetical protein